MEWERVIKAAVALERRDSRAEAKRDEREAKAERRKEEPRCWCCNRQNSDRREVLPRALRDKPKTTLTLCRICFDLTAKQAIQDNVSMVSAVFAIKHAREARTGIGMGMRHRPGESESQPSN